MIETINNNIDVIITSLMIVLFILAFGITFIICLLHDIRDILKDNRELLKLIKKDTSPYKGVN